MGGKYGRRGDTPASESATVRGANAYDGALASSGGRRVEWASGGRDEVAVALYEAAPYELTVDPIDTARLSINLVAAPVRGRIGSDRVASYGGRRYSLFFTPARADARWAKTHPSRHLNIYFPAGVLDALGSARFAALRHDLPLLNAHVPHIRPLIDAIEFSIRRPESFADQAALSVSYLIVAEMTRAAGLRRPKLAAHAIARVQDFVATHLGQKIRVADLAVIAGMSATHFTGGFHATFGCTPHEFILGQRIEAAIRSLRFTRAPLAEVAVNCGFASQQHMTTVIKQRTGLAPGQIRTRSVATSVPGRDPEGVA